MVANLHHNAQLIDWVNAQPLAQPVTCLGDGHDGVWNIVHQIATAPERREILDWYPLKENLHKVGGSIKRLKQAEALLWIGQVARKQSCCSATVGENKRRTFVPICIGINSALSILSITTIFRRKDCVLSGPVLLNR
jgi:hypothetical protein